MKISTFIWTFSFIMSLWGFWTTTNKKHISTMIESVGEIDAKKRIRLVKNLSIFLLVGSVAMIVLGTINK